ncbi:MAG TPA: Uma2 family endonuclease [Desulfobacteraceae bacterium]|nr:Uma2 family endonuclease [Desulfobacteraceae bacterium]
MGFALLKPEEYYTYRDYLNWPDDIRTELIDGVIYDMSAPSRVHQKVLTELSRQIANFLIGKPCEVYVAPFDVRLSEADEADDDILTVVQPDISVICDHGKLDDRGCRGAPDFIAEILSPSTAAHDQITKLSLYEKHAVKEYWIIDPTYKLLIVRILKENGSYGIPLIYEGKGLMRMTVLPELEINLDSVYL